MLDYRFIKENLEAVKANIEARNMTADADKVVELFDKRTELVTALQVLQTERNENAKSMKGKLEPEVRQKLIEEGKALKEKIAAMEKELSEAEVLSAYLPKQMSVEELEAALKTIMAEVGATSMKDMGKVMKAAKEQLGVTADGKMINEIVKKILA